MQSAQPDLAVPRLGLTKCCRACLGHLHFDLWRLTGRLAGWPKTNPIVIKVSLQNYKLHEGGGGHVDADVDADVDVDVDLDLDMDMGAVCTRRHCCQSRLAFAV